MQRKESPTVAPAKRTASRPVQSSRDHVPEWQQEKTVRIPVKWARHYRVLQALRERLLEEEESERSAAVQPVEPHSQSMADSATDEFDHDLALCLLARERNALGEVDAAIHRIVRGTYGICEETGKPIPAARLRVVPWTRCTKEAQEKREREGIERAPGIPRLVSIQGRDAAMLAEAENPAAEEPMTRETERHQREARLRDAGQWTGEEIEPSPEPGSPAGSESVPPARKKRAKRSSIPGHHPAKK